jgi:hypothetical protein
MDRLHEFHLTPAARDRVVARLARKVPFPTCEEYVRDHRRARELLGPEFHPWPAHPIYDLSDLIREVEAVPVGPTLGRPRHHPSEPPPDPTHCPLVLGLARSGPIARQ